MEQKLNHKDKEAREEKTRKAVYNVTMWSVHVSIAAMETTTRSATIVDLHVTANNTKILSAAQKFFYGKSV